MTNNDFKILQLGHPTLRELSQVVADISAPDTQNFLEHLLDFVIAKNGMGIAAPQVGSAKRIFIMSSRPNSRYPYAPIMEPTIVINPDIIHYSEDTEKDWEGCLSIPGVRALVPRFTSIKVRFTNQFGKMIEADYSGFIARIFQHEYDHLNGTVFLDRIEDSHDIMMEQEWLKRINQL